MNNNKNPDKKLIKLLSINLFFLFFCSYAYFYNGSGWNQDARIAQIIQMSDKGVLNINPYKEITKDFSLYENNVYPNKPFGSSLLGYPSCILLKKILHINSPLLLFYLINLISNQLPSAIAGILFFKILLHLTGKISFSLILSYAFSMGTIFFSYTSVYMGHTQAISLYIMGTYLLKNILLDEEEISSSAILSGNFLISLAVITDFFIIYLVIFVYYLQFCFFYKNNKNHFLPFFSGIAIPLIIVCLYQFFCFGSPFNIPMKFNNPIFHYNRDNLFLGAFTKPNLTILKELLTGQYYGIFAFSPVLLSGVIGIFLYLKNKSKRKFTIYIIVLPIALSLLSNSSFIGWWGGNTAGPRYLLNIIPLFLLAAAALKDFPLAKYLLIFLTLISFFFNLAIISTTIFPGKLKSLKYDIIPTFLNEKFSGNSYYPLTIADETTPEQRKISAFNIGEIFKLKGIKSLIPFFIFQIIMLTLIFNILRSKKVTFLNVDNKYIS